MKNGRSKPVTIEPMLTPEEVKAGHVAVVHDRHTHHEPENEQAGGHASGQTERLEQRET